MKVAILGAGVAGLSTAIALAQRGFEVSLYERHASATTIGAGIVVWPNASYVLDQLGVLDEIATASGVPTAMRRASSADEPLGAIDLEAISRVMGYPCFSILRRDLHRILASRLEALGGAVRYGHAVVEITVADHDRAEVRLHDGSTIRADIVVGADGRMASRARKYVVGDDAPIYQGFVNWVGVFESREDVFERIEIADYWGVGERFGIVPVSPRCAYWAGGAACATAGSTAPSENRAELASRFALWPRPVRTMIDETPLDRINKIYVYDHDPVATWHRHNLIMIGDAAHAALPTSGQGACQALEDAWHLSTCLSATPDDLERAFNTFTELRFAKTAGIIATGRALATSLFHRDPAFCAARNERSKTTDFARLAEAMARGWSQHLTLERGYVRPTLGTG